MRRRQLLVLFTIALSSLVTALPLQAQTDHPASSSQLDKVFDPLPGPDHPSELDRSRYADDR